MAHQLDPNNNTIDGHPTLTLSNCSARRDITTVGRR